MNIRNLLLGTLFFISQQLVAQNVTKEVPPAIPYWAFGHWIWEDEKNTRDAVEALVNGYARRNIPVSAVLIDSPWMNSYNHFKFNSGETLDLQPWFNCSCCPTNICRFFGISSRVHLRSGK